MKRYNVQKGSLTSFTSFINFSEEDSGEWGVFDTEDKYWVEWPYHSKEWADENAESRNSEDERG